MSSVDHSVRGLLRVTMTRILATHLLMPELVVFARPHPDIELALLSFSERANLTSPGADVAIRGVQHRRTLPIHLHGLNGPDLFGGHLLRLDDAGCAGVRHLRRQIVS